MLTESDKTHNINVKKLSQASECTIQVANMDGKDTMKYQDANENVKCRHAEQKKSNILDYPNFCCLSIYWCKT